MILKCDVALAKSKMPKMIIMKGSAKATCPKSPSIIDLSTSPSLPAPEVRTLTAKNMPMAIVMMAQISSTTRLSALRFSWISLAFCRALDSVADFLFLALAIVIPLLFYK